MNTHKVPRLVRYLITLYKIHVIVRNRVAKLEFKQTKN